MSRQLNLPLGTAPSEEATLRALAPGFVLLRGLARPYEVALLCALSEIEAQAPFRHMWTPGGLRMSVAMTNCGALGWISDAAGYRYVAKDPETGRAWPTMPAPFLELAARAAEHAGFEGFTPDACLVNRYLPGTRLSLHQDKDERDFAAPIVSVSLGLPAVFLVGGLTRKVRPERVALAHGDVLAWGGPSRLRYHGVLPIREGVHEKLGAQRVNLTFRKAG